MNETYISWEDNTNFWNTEIRLWEEVYDIIVNDLLGGGRNPEDFGEMPYQQIDNTAAIREQLQNNLNKLNTHKKDKLIEVLVQLDGDKYEIKRMVKDKKDIKITVDDVKFIATNYLNIEIEYLK